jgi:hypothetical protein
VIAGVLFIGLFAWFAVPQLAGVTDYLGRPPTGADKGTASTTVGTGVPTQREAESTHAKNDPVEPKTVVAAAREGSRRVRSRSH